MTLIVELYAVPTVPLGSAPVLMASATGLMVRLTGPVMVSTGLEVSVTFTVRLTVPATVGVPLTRQLAPRVRPVGRAPEVMVHEYGEVPPVTPMVELYGVPTVPAGSAPVLILSPAGLMISETGPVVVSTGLLLSVAFTVRLTIPAAVGVPDTTHPAPRDKPAGRVPEVTVQV